MSEFHPRAAQIQLKMSDKMNAAPWQVVASEAAIEVNGTFPPQYLLFDPATLKSRARSALL